MKFEKVMASAVGAAAMIVIATAPAALAKGKQTQSFSVGCLTQDTALQTAEGLSAGDAAATVTIASVKLLRLSSLVS